MHFIFAAVFSAIFVAGALALPVDNSARQISPTGINNYGSDTAPSMTDGTGNIVPFTNPEAGT